MSLYNMLFGYNKFAHILLRILDLDPNDVPRFRDCYLNETGDEIIVFTRTGGGNREEYEARNDAMRKWPGFIADADDTLDSTYAKFRYHVPEHLKPAMHEMVANGGVDDPTKKFRELIEGLHDPDKKNDPDIQRVVAVGRKLMSQLFDEPEKK
jgi:hypothetical protein